MTHMSEGQREAGWYDGNAFSKNSNEKEFMRRILVGNTINPQSCMDCLWDGELLN